MPKRIIKLNSTTGPVYIDLDRVSTVMAGRNVITGERVINIFVGNHTLPLDSTFLPEITTAMDAWMEHKNK